MKISMLIVLTIFFIQVDKLQAQRNTVFVEGMGAGGIGSISYERQLTKKPELMIRAGVGTLVFDKTIPVGVDYLFPLKKIMSFSKLDWPIRS